MNNTLHVVAVVSNPCEYKIRWKLMKEFIDRMELTDGIELYVVEMVYNDQTFHITEPNNTKHLQLRCSSILWHKENMINIGVKKLFPSNWQYMAWIDGDIEFTNKNWVSETIHKLNAFDIVQLFETCDDLDSSGIPMYIHKSFGSQWAISEKMQKALKKELIIPEHPGYAWACTRNFYDKIGIYDKSIIGYGDKIITYAIIRNKKLMYDVTLINANNDTIEYMNKFENIKFGFVNGKILHYYHGTKQNRQYFERAQLMLENKFDPTLQITYDENGILIPTEHMTDEFLEKILKYFKNRQEDK
jgi:hypothetical protein